MRCYRLIKVGISMPRIMHCILLVSQLLSPKDTGLWKHEEKWTIF